MAQEKIASIVQHHYLFSLNPKPILNRYLLILIAAFVLMAPPIVHRAHFYADYGAHVGWARDWMEQGSLWEPPRPHFLFHLLVIGVYRLSGTLSWALSGAVVAISFSLLTAAILFDWALKALSDFVPQRQRVALAVAAAASLLIIAPINLATYFEENLYLGYIGLSTYHSPTILVLRPLALLLFAYVVSAASDSEPAASNTMLLSAVIIAAAGTLAKPNFSLDLLPALVIIAECSLLKRQRMNWTLMLSVGLTLVLVLAWQYIYFYDLGKGVVTEDSKVIFAPFLAASTFSDLLLPKFLLSIAFPAAVYTLYWQQARKDTALNIAWLLFIISLFDTYFMAEIRDGLPTSNFLWSTQITLFIVFTRSMMFLLGNYSQRLGAPNHGDGDDTTVVRTRRSLTLCAVFYVLHVIGGVLWYWAQFSELLPSARPVGNWF
jgi:hypothetical protein